MLNVPANQTESESEYLLSQYKFTRKLVFQRTATNRINNRLINTATNRINNRLINTATKANTYQTHTVYYYHSIEK